MDTCLVRSLSVWILRFHCECMDVDLRVPGLILGFQCGDWDSIVNSGISVWIMGLECDTCNSNVKPDISVRILVSKGNSEISVWFLEFPVWILRFQCSYWDTSGYFEFPVWILEFQCGSLDYNMDPGFIYLYK